MALDYSFWPKSSGRTGFLSVAPGPVAKVDTQLPAASHIQSMGVQSELVQGTAGQFWALASTRRTRIGTQETIISTGDRRWESGG